MNFKSMEKFRCGAFYAATLVSAQRNEKFNFLKDQLTSIDLIVACCRFT